MICKQCGKRYKTIAIVDGKSRNLRNRTKCLKCMPIGTSIYATNYSNLSEEERKKKYLQRKAKNYRDYYIRNKKRIEKISKNRKNGLINLIGGCQKCGHTKPYNLSFHHVGNGKDFGVDRRRCQYSWELVKPEILKCVLLCHNCHGDAHYDNLDCSNMHEKIIKLISPLSDWPQPKIPIV